ncbi:hypothetical protein WOLCODRAFT_167245 [Wolfiporia cocos MD-104 SS10]|uniref:Uncharacterized protein n=1 Tax=Wolfiporia cocos (strain MD-104) TaxID=742152 RepID=A0A2H3JLT9_WOLCO|nr:hypothetical protein WOLCODRAFT_167245 [Wolfiporia cocos MD-104 SS10]
MRWLYSKRNRGLAITPYNLPRDVYTPYPVRRQRQPDRPLLFGLCSSDELLTPDARSHISPLPLDTHSPSAARPPRWSWDGTPSSPGLYPATKVDVFHAPPAVSMSSVQSRHVSQPAPRRSVSLAHMLDEMPPPRRSVDGCVRLAGGPPGESAQHDVVSVHTLPPAYQW